VITLSIFFLETYSQDMKIGVVGSRGLVGRELISILKERHFPYDELKETHEGCDLVFLCVSSEAAEELVPQIQGTVIDLSSAFRSSAPLIIPEINGHLLQDQPQLISSPNCTTSIMVMALASLHRTYGIKQIVCSSYQAMSGAGYRTLEAFEQTPHQELNLYLLEEEEQKLIHETRKILDDPSIEVIPTCVRVPIPRVHSLSLHVTFDREPRELSFLDGVILQEEITPLDASGHDPVFVGRVRKSEKKSLDLWVMGDQLRKGAALNAVQIAESLANEELYAIHSLYR